MGIDGSELLSGIFGFDPDIPGTFGSLSLAVGNDHDPTDSLPTNLLDRLIPESIGIGVGLGVYDSLGGVPGELGLGGMVYSNISPEKALTLGMTHVSAGFAIAEGTVALLATILSQTSKLPPMLLNSTE